MTLNSLTQRITRGKKLEGKSNSPAIDHSPARKKRKEIKMTFHEKPKEFRPLENCIYAKKGRYARCIEISWLEIYLIPNWMNSENNLECSGALDWSAYNRYLTHSRNPIYSPWFNSFIIKNFYFFFLLFGVFAFHKNNFHIIRKPQLDISGMSFIYKPGKQFFFFVKWPFW